MFDFSWSEILLIGIVALVFIGPKELPGVLRTLGQWMSKIRRMAGEFQNQFHDAMREAELADLKKEVDEMRAQTSKYANFDPLNDVRKDMEAAQREIESAVTGTPAEHPPAPDATVTAPLSESTEAAALPEPQNPSPEAPTSGGVETPAKHSVAGSEPA